MPKIKLFLLLFLFPGILFAVVWHIEDMAEISCLWSDTKFNDPLSQLAQTALFPDTLSIISGWSPVFSSFGIHEGLLYAGFRNIDLSLKTQYHRLMTNHVLAAGFPVLREEHILAGLRINYAFSTIQGYSAQQAGSCSGGVVMHPESQWQISLQSLNALSFADDSSRFFEPCTYASAVFSPGGGLNIAGGLNKRKDLPWQVYFGVSYRLREMLHISADLECYTGDLRFSVVLKIKRWHIYECVRFHPGLGMSQSIFLSYAY